MPPKKNPIIEGLDALSVDGDIDSGDDACYGSCDSTPIHRTRSNRSTTVADMRAEWYAERFASDKPKTIRIQPFMSSTFKVFSSRLAAPPSHNTLMKDFSDERRHLRERVFPELQHMATTRGGTFSPIDLIWVIVIGPHYSIHMLVRVRGSARSSPRLAR